MSCLEPCDANATCIAQDGSGMNNRCVCAEGFVAGGVNGPTGLTGVVCTPGDRCSDALSVTFEKNGFESAADCITRDVCLSRNSAQRMYNAALARGAADSTDTPIGTLWANMTCAAAAASMTNPFVNFMNAVGSGDGVVGRDLCLYLVDAGLLYDVLFSRHASGDVGAPFAYTRTPFGTYLNNTFTDANADPDVLAQIACGAAGATGCVSSGPLGCTGVTGFVAGADGRLSLPDPCEPSPCGVGAVCRRDGLTGHHCECDPVTFVKENYETKFDCIRPGVCLTRGNEASLYNASQESQPEGGNGCTASPAGTLWAFTACSDPSAVFVPFNEAGKTIDGPFICPPVRVLGMRACLQLSDAPTLEYDLEFVDWTARAVGGGMVYRRWRGVGDGVDCTP